MCDGLFCARCLKPHRPLRVWVPNHFTSATCVWIQLGTWRLFLLPRGMWNGMVAKDELHMDAFCIAGEERMGTCMALPVVDDVSREQQAQG